MSRVEARPSPWVTRWAHLAAPGATVLDLACGSGRHLRWWAARGHRVTGVDRDAAALSGLAGLGELVEADLEGGPWPLRGRQFGVVIVTNYLWRPLFDDLLEAIEPGGLLMYETFAQGQAAFGRPSRDDFLLTPGELLQRCAGLRVLAYEEGVVAEPKRCVQRVAAWRALADAAPRELEPERLAAGARGGGGAAPG